MDKPWTTHRLTVDAAEGERTTTPSDMLGREWLLTNGTGGYSMGTALGCNTRRYQGLLVAATNPPVGRVVALNQVFDQLILSDGDGSDQPDQSIELGSCLFRNDEGQLVHAPHGDQVISGFTRGLSVAWTYRWGKLSVERELVLHDGEQAITLRYRVSGLKQLGGRATLRVAPMLTLRDFHSLVHREFNSEGFAVKTTGRGKKVTVAQGDTAVTLASADGTFTAAPDWWLGLTYPRETYRGQEDQEDYFVPGHFDLPLSTDGKTASVTITVALGQKAAEPKTKPGRATGLKKHADALPGDTALAKALAIAADDFVVQRHLGGKKLSTIIAGYPWFADWGRDTFIALPGLLLTTGRLNAARDTLRAFAGVIRDGLVPNRFDDYTNEPHYNTVDGSLWYVAAGLAYIEASGTSPKWLTRAMTQIVDAYAAGTNAHGHDGRAIPIAMDDDGLIAAGDDHSQLTWMDAACDDAVFTPRPGKCVEINALWYHALTGLSARLEEGTAKDVAAAEGYTKLAKRVKRSFVSTFWSNDWNRLIDHVTPAGQVDPSLRPNMVFACSLPNSPLPAAKRKAVLAAIKDHLLTPMGLRTLPADDPNYHPHYAGPQFDRDKSYHQGTVWPWPLGAYAEGVLRTGKFSKKAKAEATAALQPLVDRLLDQGLGQLHEIFDADAGFTGIHEPRGCPAQAWSIGEVVRVLGLIETS
ncbi:MAG: amylo-alpha-1,6-glucosidase [Planctomycetota bacterium]